MGDNGKTSLVGSRVSKDNLYIEVCGSIDELNSSIGLMKSFSKFNEINSFIKKVQEDLFIMGAELSNVTNEGSSYKITNENVKFIEKFSDELEKYIKPLNKFVLPGGSNIASLSHLSRSICRRVERKIIKLSKEKKINPIIICYINRLSDVLFIISRYTNQKLNIKETVWGPDNLLGI